MSALNAKIVPFPAAESMPKPSSNSQAVDSASDDRASKRFRGGGLRGLFWALLLEGGLMILAAGVLFTWHVLRR